MKKGDILTLDVIDMGINGEGIAKSDGIPVFLPYAVDGEKVKAKIVHCKKDMAFGEVLEIVNSSPHRIKPFCIHFKKCGGCDVQHLEYSYQLEVKKQNVLKTLKKIAGISVDIQNVFHAAEWEYRNKLSLPFGKKGDRVVVGFYGKSSHDVVPLKYCPLHGEWLKSLIKIVCDYANEFKISVYDEKTKKGLLRHLVARMIDSLSVTIVINGKSLPKAEVLYERLKEKFGEVALYISENTKNTNVIMGDTVSLIFGKEQKQSLGAFSAAVSPLEQKQSLGAFSAAVSPLSFLQVNLEVMQMLYDKAAEKIEGDKVLELYSGVGLLTAQIASRLPSAKITAVEIVPSATRGADNLMRDLGFSGRVKNVCADAGKFVEAQKGKLPFDCTLLDPPRKGCDRAVLEAVKNSGIKKNIYISCNPATLARDIKILSDAYTVESVNLFDMFPQTCHVETLAVLYIK